MLKKITAIVSSNKSKFVRKAAIIGGVVLGIGIGVLLKAGEDDSLILVGEIVPAPGEADYEDAADSDVNATDDPEA